MEKVGGLTIAKLGLALDVSALRHKAIASNIANADAAGYIPKEVSFADQMKAIQALDVQSHPLPSFGGLDSLVKARVIDGNRSPSISLDGEVVDMAQNAVHYQALLKGLNKQFSILASAINEGKK